MIPFTKQYDVTYVSEITSFSMQTWFRPWITRNGHFSVIFPAAAYHWEAVQTACSGDVISSCSKVGEAVRSGSFTLQQHSNIFITVKSSPRQDNPCSPLHQSLPLFFFFCSASSQVEWVSEWRALRPKSDFQLLKPSDSFIWISAGGPERSNFDSNPNLRSIPLITSLLRPQTYILGAGLNKKKTYCILNLKIICFSLRMKQNLKTYKTKSVFFRG